MVYLTPADYTQKTVSNPRMLQKGGTVAPGRYNRSRKNMVTSAGLLNRMDWTAQHMRSECALTNKCLPIGMGAEAVGQPVPGTPGKVFAACTDTERATRLQNARTCAMRVLATKGGIYGRTA